MELNSKTTVWYTYRQISTKVPAWLGLLGISVFWVLPIWLPEYFAGFNIWTIDALSSLILRSVFVSSIEFNYPWKRTSVFQKVRWADILIIGPLRCIFSAFPAKFSRKVTDCWCKKISYPNKLVSKYFIPQQNHANSFHTPTLSPPPPPPPALIFFMTAPQGAETYIQIEVILVLINFACKLRIRFAALFEKHLYILIWLQLLIRNLKYSHAGKWH